MIRPHSVTRGAEMAGVQHMTATQTVAPEAPFGDALRTAVRCRGLTLERIRWHLSRRGLHVGLSSLSDWQHGRSLPASAKSLSAVRALEEILELTPGSLSRLLCAPRVRPAAPREGLDESGTPIEKLLRSVRDTTGEFDILARTGKVVVDSERRASTMTDLTAIRARRSGLDRYVMRYLGDPGCQIEEVQFTRLDNCRLGRIMRQPDQEYPAMVTELLFDRPLEAGDTWVFGTEIVDFTGEPCTDFAQGFRQRVGQFVLEVQFDPAVTPVDLHTFAEIGLNSGRDRQQSLSLNAHRSTHLVASDIQTGVLGIAWDWGSAD
jgi:hypothetical protein